MGTVAVSRSTLGGAAVDVAPQLLNTLLSVGPLLARIIEVEAYGGADDAASHAFRGRTRRNQAMFGRAGHLYVYRSYGIHWCANVVVGPSEEAQAVLIRAVEPVRGTDAMSAARGGRSVAEIGNGPGKLCQALGITGADDGTDLCSSTGRMRLLRDDTPAPCDPLTTTRVGISRATERPWRFVVPGHLGVSPGRPSHVTLPDGPVRMGR